MSDTGWVILALVLCSGGMLLFSVAAISLRTFSHLKLQEAFRKIDKDKGAEQLARGAERLMLACSSYRLVLNACILVLLSVLFVQPGESGSKLYGYILTAVSGGCILLLVGLAIPQALAKYAGEKVLSHTYTLLRIAEAGSTPMLLVLKLTDGLVRRLAGVALTTPEEEQEEKQEEFLTDLDQQRIEGVVDQEEQDMIENVLELSETTADEIMTPRTDIVAVDVNSSLQTVLDMIANGGHTRVPVYDGNVDRIVGLVYAKDLLSEIGKDPSQFKLSEHMREAYFVPESKLLRVLLHEFQNQKLHIAVVLDEYGGTAGVVTLEDILEELVGEITDEYEETPEEAVAQVDENTIEVDARTYVDDLNDRFELGLPEDEAYDTIGGFVFSQLGYIPKSGENFEYANLKFAVISAEARKIKRLRIERSAEQ